MECIIVSTADIKKRKTLAVCMFNLLSLKKASKAELWNTFKAHINMWDRFSLLFYLALLLTVIPSAQVIF